MSSLFYRLGMGLLFVLPATTTVCAQEISEIWDAPITPGWMNDHVAAAERRSHVRSTFRLTRTEVWADGLARSGMHAFVPTDFDRTVGAKLQPFHDLNFRVGTALTRSGGEESLLSSSATWEAFWSRDSQTLGGLTFGLSTTGFVDNLQTSYSQALSGTLGLPLNLSIDRLHTEFRLSPSMNLNTASGSVGTGLLSEIMGQTEIGSRNDPFRSVLNVSLGYHLAPETRPVASARLELRISPNL